MVDKIYNTESEDERPTPPCDHCKTGVYEFNSYCGAYVCDNCGDHKGLARCYCGFSTSGYDGRKELEEMGETIDPD